MAASGVAEQIDNADQTLDELIEQKVEEKVEQRVAEVEAKYEQQLNEKDETIEFLKEELWTFEDILLGEFDSAMASTLTNEEGGVLERVEELESYAADKNRLEDVENTVQRHDSIIEEQGTPSGSSKEKKWQDTIQAAENLKNKADHQIGDGWVKLFTDNIEQATGCCGRRAGQLIDEWSEEKRGTELVPYKRYTTSRKTKSSSVQRKALKIDLDVWGSE